ncbi:hypothetical protein OG462_41560 [Streptomyces sp. NBC_01077]|uniref:hypothetical protein n=1 Tax=Streptomyces sp. NBC_01077 TaxID=2903746 RepID=UPI003865C690|nr:hypothetical protein OG462_41560 [Streptomyces sp. NBC_01077]
MTESYTSSPIGDLWQAKAANALDRAVITTTVPDGCRGLAVEVVTALMKARLPISDLHADAFEDRCGVALSVVPGAWWPSDAVAAAPAHGGPGR